MPYAKDALSEGEQAETRSEVQHFEVGEEDVGQRLDNCLQRRLGSVPRSRIYRIIRKGEVRVNGRRVGPELRLQLHDRIRIPPMRPVPVAPVPRPGPNLARL